MLFIKSKINNRTKSLTFYLSFLALVFILLMPVITNLFFERNHEVLATEQNLGQIEFEKEWSNLYTALDLTENTKLNRFNIQYNENGEIFGLDCELITLAGGNYTLYKVDFNPARELYVIKLKKINQWAQFDRLVLAERFFQVLDKLDFLENQPDGENISYGIASQGDFYIFH